MANRHPNQSNNLVVYDLRKKVITIIAKLLLLPFCWLATGADVWAKTLSAENDPVKLAQSISEYRNINIPPEALKRLQKTALESRVALNRNYTPIKHTTHPERKAVKAQQEVVNELRVLRKDKELSSKQFSKKMVQIKEKLSGSHKIILDGFVSTDKLFNNKSIAENIIHKHDIHRAFYMKNWDVLQEKLKEAEVSTDPLTRNEAIDFSIKFLNSSHDQRPEQPFDANKLPFAVSKPTKRTPRSNWEVPPKQSSLSIKAINSLVDFLIPSVVAAPIPISAEDLAETEDVQITPEIIALAGSLGNQPLAIYNWVRNNIDFLATYGSVQGSQLTLELKRGNATDISSLLIALLRAANIPARYVTGTINMPVADVINWLGDVPSADFAQQVLGSGGIPNVAIIDGASNITSFDFEHTWVEVYVDMIPSRSALHLIGDTWVNMDAAFKNYTVIPPSNLSSDVPFDAVMDSFQSSITVDENLGALTDFNDESTFDPFETWVIDANNYLDSKGIPQTQKGILGSKNIIQKNNSVLPGTLPFSVKSNAVAVADLPASLRHKIQIVGYSSSLNRTLGSPDFSTTINLASLGSKSLSLTFDPASTGDAAVLQAAIDGGAASLPISSVNVLPTFKVNDIVVNSGSTVGMGRDYYLDVVLSGPDGTNTSQYDVIAGDNIVVGVTGNGFSQDVLQKRLDNNPVSSTIEYLHQVSLHYWTETDFLNYNTSVGMGGYIVRLPSAGLFSTPLTVSYLFGMPNTGVYASKFMDVKRSYIGAAATTTADNVTLVKQAGFNGSYMEGTTFDQFENTITNIPKIRSIDSMKLLMTASSQGVPLYKITQSNQASVFPLLNLDANVESNISAALAQGQTVFTSRDNVSIGSWSGAGYILQNETTGEGAYLISGGLNGGGLADCIEELIGDIVSIVVLVLLAILLAILLYYLALAAAAALAGIGLGALAAEAWAGFLIMMRMLALTYRVVPG